ncbi:hypothetical protein [Pseudoalteromonas denitrificans]|jgi:hypothetical protein|uniref:Uncharacterized protein n=1 Tax=Pseudoalteromonas denitrificans DSM 6059 TaxID=1123010 RepID=A0A1I1GQG1_9GAMM|nr:hypothetical protein [Pseudoalteromonas denitrificans]SFC13874.1 hypothetical protein SAMN02745724_00995 [Pseudoalteromonas denitrificans DSM 6059]
MFIRSYILCIALFLCIACGGGGSSDTPAPTLKTHLIGNGFYTEQSNASQALYVSGQSAFAYSRLRNGTTLSKVLTFTANGSVIGTHFDTAEQKWVEVQGNFKEDVYSYQCKNISDAGNTCINALKSVNYKKDSGRVAKRPSNDDVNKTYQANNWIIQLSGESEQFQIIVDNGNSLSFEFIATSTSWGGYKLASDTGNEQALIAFYQVGNLSYFDLLISNNAENINISNIPF